MKQQLKKLVHERAIEKYGEISDYHKYRIVSELRKIAEINEEDGVLFMEKLISIAKKLNIQIKVDQEQIKSSFVFYLLGISQIDPIEAGLRFELPDIGEIRIEQSAEDIAAIQKEFPDEEDVLSFCAFIKDKQESQPTENR